MRKIEKPCTIPKSLNGTTISTKRTELIDNQGYIDEKKYNAWYKKEDVKTALKDIYHHKCAFCEYKVEQFEVEHFRPKSLYWWLAYSWDNLLCICTTCNKAKLDKFEIKGQKVTFDPAHLERIHSLFDDYNTCEQPLFINPEKEDITQYLRFNELGEVSSDDERVAYTIREIKLNREYLVEQRKTIWDKAKAEIIDILVSYPQEQRLQEFKRFIEKYRKKAENEKHTFSTLRLCMLPILAQSVKQALQS